MGYSNAADSSGSSGHEQRAQDPDLDSSGCSGFEREILSGCQGGSRVRIPSSAPSKIAQRLGITVGPSRIPDLVAAARFDAIREHAGALDPDSTREVWRDNRQFFSSGRSGQSQTLLDDGDRWRYAERVSKVQPPDLIESVLGDTTLYSIASV